jgi:isopenicillin N synthase-like dioxygenase
VEHRVVTNQGAARLTVATFRHAGGEAEVGPAPAMVDAAHPALYPTTNYAAYRANFHHRGDNGKVLASSAGARGH